VAAGGTSLPGDPIRVTVWTDLPAERAPEAVRGVYPGGIAESIAAAVREAADRPVDVRVATMDEPGQGLPAAVLDPTDVLVWWGHLRHDEVADELAARVHAAVLRGMGFVALHSSALSKPFVALMGTTCTFRWREAGDRELIWVVHPGHPIARGLPEVIELPAHEMYGEPFDIPAPDELVFISSFSGGEVFRSGCCFQRGNGRVFSFSPGHETDPVYHHPEIRRVIANAVVWAHGAGARLARDREPIHAPDGPPTAGR
jgi:trehalose utilization protein